VASPNPASVNGDLLRCVKKTRKTLEVLAKTGKVFYRYGHIDFLFIAQLGDAI
jgi:hypothetical protein